MDNRTSGVDLSQNLGKDSMGFKKEREVIGLDRDGMGLKVL